MLSLFSREGRRDREREDDDAMVTGFLADDANDDSDIEATQRLEDDEPPAPTKSTNSFDFVGASPTSRPFSRAFDTVWRVMQRSGWVTAQGPGTEFVSMPGTEFFNFRPNINVFDGKGKACWKWLSLAIKDEANTNSTDDREVWDALWTVAEKELAWFTMASGTETWFVSPNTTFEKFQPNVTIFQSKKRAVAQCLALQKVKISLGDSVEGPQVLDFTGADTNKPKKPTPTKSDTSGDSFTTPPPKKSVASSSASSSSKKKSSSSSSKTTPTSGKKSTPTSSSKKTPTKKVTASKKATPPTAASKTKKPEPPLQFRAPEFRCSFGLVYERLQQRGWYHRSGSFEYDYFSPAYTEENAILGGNYFQSQAQLEGFVKDSGLWQEIEEELRRDHAELVEELREEAEHRRRQLKERLAAKKKQDAAAKAKTKTNSPAPTKPTTNSTTPTPPPASTKSDAAAKKKPTPAPAKRKSSFAEALRPPPELNITFGKILEKIKKRGWTYKPGRFEYDYFKPNVNVKTARLNEDFFQSSTELETYLKTSGLWDEIARELQDEYIATLAKEAAEEDEEEKGEGRSSKKARVEEPLAPAAAALTNDIWGNSHQFDFERY